MGERRIDWTGHGPSDGPVALEALHLRIAEQADEDGDTLISGEARLFNRTAAPVADVEVRLVLRGEHGVVFDTVEAASTGLEPARLIDLSLWGLAKAGAYDITGIDVFIRTSRQSESEGEVELHPPSEGAWPLRARQPSSAAGGDAVQVHRLDASITAPDEDGDHQVMVWVEIGCLGPCQDEADLHVQVRDLAGDLMADEVLGGAPVVPGRQVSGFEGYIQVPSGPALLRWQLTTRAHRWWGPTSIPTPLTTAS